MTPLSGASYRDYNPTNPPTSGPWVPPGPVTSMTAGKAALTALVAGS